MPASSKMDPLLAKAEPIRDGGRTSVIMCLRREWEYMRETALQAPRLPKKEEEEVLPGARAAIPLQPVDKINVEADCAPAAHRGPWWSRSPPAAPGGPPAKAAECPKEVVSLWEAHAGAGFWQDLWTHGGPTLEPSVPEGLHPMEGTHAGAICEEVQPVGRTHVGAVHGGLSPVGGTPHWSRAECEESSL